MGRVSLWGLGFLLIVAACSSSTDSTPSTTTPLSIETTTSTTTTTTTISTTTTQATTATAAPEDDGLIGTQDAYDTLVDEVIGDVRFRSIFADLEREDVPLPNLRAADPVQALEEILAFDAWIFENAPVAAWADLLAPRGSPWWEDTARLLDSFTTGRLKIEVTGAPWSLRSSSRVADVEELSAWAIDGVDLDGAVVVAFESERGTYNRVDWDTNEVESPRDGWHANGVAVLVPTAIGWQMHDLATDDA